MNDNNSKHEWRIYIRANGPDGAAVFPTCSHEISGYTHKFNIYIL